MTRVLQLINSFHQGGSERQAVQLVRLLAADGRVAVEAAALDATGVLRPEIERVVAGPLPEFRLTSFYDANFLVQLRRAARFLRERRIDVVQTHDFYTNVFGMFAARLAGTPRAVAAKRETGGMRTPLQKRVEKLAFRQAHAIVVNSAAVRDYLLAEKIPAEKLRLVYNGLDLERLTPPPFARAALCESLGLPVGAGVKFVTLVANLRHAVKNQPMFLRVARRLAEQFPDVYFVLAGEGALRPALETLAASLGVAEKVRFVGLCTRVPELLAISEICVLTSFNEGFSNSILEYMAAARPVVATDVGGAREAIVEGETGFLVASDDDAAMAARVAELLADAERAGEFGARGRRRVETEFSCAAQLAATLRIYGVDER